MDAGQIPIPTPATAHFWEGARAGVLRLQRCRTCRECYFPPQPFCPRCGSSDVEIFDASGRGRVHTFIISEFRSSGFSPPYSIAVIELDEGPRLLSNIVDCPQTSEAIRMEMPVEATFTPVSETISLVKFRPVEDI